MNNKKGFTLIELLAVIVILAVIALIATPIIMNMIENAKKGAAKSSALHYLNGLDYAITQHEIYGKTEVLTGEYDLSVVNQTFNVKERVKKKIPTKGRIIFEKNNYTEALLCVDNYLIQYKKGKAEVISNSCDEFSYAVITDLTTEINDNKVDVTITVDDETLVKNYSYSLDGNSYTESSNKFTIENLVENKLYKLYVKVISKNGVEKIYEKDIVISNVAEPTFEVIEPDTEWASYRKIAITYSEGDALVNQYKIGNGLWQKYTEAITVKENTSIYARSLIGGQEAASSNFSIDSIDSVAPTIKEVTIEGTKGTFTFQDNESGLSSYCVNTTNDSTKCTWTNLTSGEKTETITYTSQNQGTNYLFVKDLSGNVSKVKEVTFNYNIGAPITYAGYNWHVVNDDGENLTILMDGNQSGEHGEKFLKGMGHNTSKTTYSWGTSLINAYLNNEFYNSLPKEVQDSIVEASICNDAGASATGGYLSTQGKDCTTGYVTSKIRLITLPEFNDLNKNAANVTTWLRCASTTCGNSKSNSGIENGRWWTMNNNPSNGNFAYAIFDTGASLSNWASNVYGVRPVMTIKK